MILHKLDLSDPLFTAKEHAVTAPVPRIALVTGANKGIGFETARQIGRAGHRVLLGARSKPLGEAAAARLRDEGIDARFIHLDLASPSSIQAPAAGIAAEPGGRLDVLVNNAGITDPADGPPTVTDLAAVRRIFDTNFFGALAVIQAMVPLLRQSASARVVNVSSGLGSIQHNSDPAWEFAPVKLLGYNASKAALNMLTVQLAAELKAQGIKVNSADPGFTATDLNGHRGHQSVEEGAAAVVALALLPDDGASGEFFSAAGTEPW
jgi:NAD(P)-dependent dehydrogenase (short-subunit alcohol dehydrogenase family)